MARKTWPLLHEGDVVEVVAPGFASTPDEVEAGRRFLVRWGLIPRIPAGLIAPHFLMANTDEKRFAYLKKALTSEDSSAVWCLRGGYGANRLLPMLRKMKKPGKQKLLIGLSDVTSLHVFLQQEWGWPVLHGPLLDRAGLGKLPPKVESELRRVLFGEQGSVVFRKLKSMNDAAKKVRTIEAPVTGGNMVVLQSTLGTPDQVDLRGKFLFLEELGERGYRIDRIFEHLRQAGALKGCKAIFIGEILGGAEPSTGKPLWPLVFKSWARELEIPVFDGFELGHGVVQRPLPMGTRAVLRGGARPTLEVFTK